MASPKSPKSIPARVLPDEQAVMQELGRVDRTLDLADCPGFDFAPGAVEVRIDRVVARVDRMMSRLEWIELGSTLMELLSGGGQAVVKVPFGCLTTNIGRVLTGAGLEREAVYVTEEASWFVFNRVRTASNWNVEYRGKSRDDIAAEAAS